jgi:hypothetical protein
VAIVLSGKQGFWKGKTRETNQAGCDCEGDCVE